MEEEIGSGGVFLAELSTSLHNTLSVGWVLLVTLVVPIYVIIWTRVRKSKVISGANKDCTKYFQPTASQIQNYLLKPGNDVIIIEGKHNTGKSFILAEVCHQIRADNSVGVELIVVDPSDKIRHTITTHTKFVLADRFRYSWFRALLQFLKISLNENKYPLPAIQKRLKRKGCVLFVLVTNVTSDFVTDIVSSINSFRTLGKENRIKLIVTTNDVECSRKLQEVECEIFKTPLPDSFSTYILDRLHQTVSPHHWLNVSQLDNSVQPLLTIISNGYYLDFEVVKALLDKIALLIEKVDHVEPEQLRQPYLELLILLVFLRSIYPSLLLELKTHGDAVFMATHGGQESLYLFSLGGVFERMDSNLRIHLGKKIHEYSCNYASYDSGMGGVKDKWVNMLANCSELLKSTGE